MRRSNLLLLVTVVATSVPLSAAWAARDAACDARPEAGSAVRSCADDARSAYPLADLFQGSSESGASLAIAGLGLAVMAIRTRGR